MTVGAAASTADVMVVEACASVDPEVMFPEDEHGRTPASVELIEEAKRVCYSCDLRSTCLERAIAQRHQFGIWGGLTTPEREALRRRQYRRGAKRVEADVRALAAPQHGYRWASEDATLDFAV